MKRATRYLAGALLASSILVSPVSAFEDNDEKIKNLEAKLEQALKLIQSLSAEVEKLKKNQEGNVPEVAVSTRRLDDAEARLDDVESLILDTQDRLPSGSVVGAFDADTLNIGGFLLSTLTHVDGEDGSATSFNRNVFEILIGGNLNDDISYFFAQAFIREASPAFVDPEGRRDPSFANLATGAPTPIAWANYRFSDALNVRLGRFVAPHGIINIEHFPAILLDTEQPQFLRPFGGQTIFANFQTGVQVHGQKYLGLGGKGRLDYAVYAANFGGNQGEFNVGGRVGYTFADSGFTVGLNTAFGQRAEGVDSDYQLFGADLLYDKGPILWKTEVFTTTEDLGDNRFAFYTQPAYRIDDKWTAFYRYDYLDSGRRASPIDAIAGIDTVGIGTSREHVLGLAFNPVPTLRIRGTATFRHFNAGELGVFREADATLYQLSTTLSF